MREQSRETMESIFKLAGFPIRHMWELANGYWPLHPDYDNVRQPWWLVETDIGLIKIGKRKKVLSISWEACRVRGIVTTDEVTKEETLVHAWVVEKAIEYLRELRRLALAQRMCVMDAGTE